MPLPRRPDDLSGDLPPLDGPLEGEDEDESGGGGGDAADEELDALIEDAGDPMDDATNEHEPVLGETFNAAPGANESDLEHDDAESVPDLDVGNDAVDFEEGFMDDATEDAPAEDTDLAAEIAPSVGDAGEEGPSDADEALREEDLPSLDADDGGEGDERHFFDKLGGEEAPLPWARERWEPTPVTVRPEVGPVSLVAAAPLGALALGERLMRVEIDGPVVPLAAEGLPEEGRRALVVGPTRSSHPAIFVQAAAGTYRSDDGGASFAPSDAAPLEVGVDVDRLGVLLPTGFEIAAATRAGDGLLVLVRALSYGRLYLATLAKDRWELVLEFPEPESDADGGASDLTLGWDPQRSLLWVGGAFGLLALQPRRGA